MKLSRKYEFFTGHAKGAGAKNIEYFQKKKFDVFFLHLGEYNQNGK